VNWLELLPWGTVFIGLILSGAGMKSSWYFWQQHRALEYNWVLQAVFRTCVTITIACFGLTVSRITTLIWGPNEISYTASGLLVVWILLIPWFLFHLFVKKEGMHHE
jgi:hypothetical protein